jgi:hypothetical protein
MDSGDHVLSAGLYRLENKSHTEWSHTVPT